MARAFGKLLKATKRKKLERSRQQTLGEEMDGYFDFAALKAFIGRGRL